MSDDSRSNCKNERLAVMRSTLIERLNLDPVDLQFQISVN